MTCEQSIKIVEETLSQKLSPELAAIARRFEIHYTPKHGSWLNMAEIEIGLLVRQGLDKRIATPQLFRTQIENYLKRKNSSPKPINWQFTDQEARVKLRHLYPSL